jgi:hypothetical protein
VGEILGLGITHQPTLAAKQYRPFALWRALDDPLLPQRFRDGTAWPDRLREQWGSDRGLASCEQHRQAIIEQFAIVRRALDDFQPDVVLIWGDDQYENFKDDVIPAFCVMAVDKFVFPVPRYGGEPNIWDDPAERTMEVKGHRAAGKFLASALLRSGFDVAYAYKVLHDDLAIAFSRSVLYLDWERRGFPYALLPISVNCYGSHVTVDHGLPAPMPSASLSEEALDPPAPSPSRCFELGAATARAFRDGPYRVALVASSSWSHAFLTEKTYKMLPDLDSDRAMFESLKAGTFESWTARSLEDIEASGQHEMLNWYCLAGAMSELGRRPQHAVLLESSVANSNKVMAIYPQ